MALFDSNELQPLDIQSVDYVVRSYFENRDDISLSADEVSLDELAGSPEWTMVQMVDQFLVCLFNKKLYKRVRANYATVGLESTMPTRAEPTLDFIKQFFIYEIVMRVNLSDEQKRIVLDRAEKAVATFEDGHYKARDAIEIFSEMVQEIQYFEAIDDYEPYPGMASPQDSQKLIKRVIADNKKLLDFYLMINPRIARLLEEHDEKF